MDATVMHSDNNVANHAHLHTQHTHTHSHIHTFSSICRSFVRMHCTSGAKLLSKVVINFVAFFIPQQSIYTFV